MLTESYQLAASSEKEKDKLEGQPNDDAQKNKEYA